MVRVRVHFLSSCYSQTLCIWQALNSPNFNCSTSSGGHLSVLGGKYYTITSCFSSLLLVTSNLHSHCDVYAVWRVYKVGPTRIFSKNQHNWMKLYHTTHIWMQREDAYRCEYLALYLPPAMQFSIKGTEFLPAGRIGAVRALILRLPVRSSQCRHSATALEIRQFQRSLAMVNFLQLPLDNIPTDISALSGRAGRWPSPKPWWSSQWCHSSCPIFKSRSSIYVPSCTQRSWKAPGQRKRQVFSPDFLSRWPYRKIWCFLVKCQPGPGWHPPPWSWSQVMSESMDVSQDERQNGVGGFPRSITWTRKLWQHDEEWWRKTSTVSDASLWWSWSWRSKKLWRRKLSFDLIFYLFLVGFAILATRLHHEWSGFRCGVYLHGRRFFSRSWCTADSSFLGYFWSQWFAFLSAWCRICGKIKRIFENVGVPYDQRCYFRAE